MCDTTSRRRRPARSATSNGYGLRPSWNEPGSSSPPPADRIDLALHPDPLLPLPTTFAGLLPDLPTGGTSSPSPTSEESPGPWSWRQADSSAHLTTVHSPHLPSLIDGGANATLRVAADTSTLVAEGSSRASRSAGRGSVAPTASTFL